ncbi:hypothetical protein BGZ76_005612, partial [Entomortierella beljakovae]
MVLSAQDYVAFRVKESPNPLTAFIQHQEWQQWLLILKQSNLGRYKNAANQASMPSKSIINGWLDNPKTVAAPCSRVLRSASSRARHVDIEDDNLQTNEANSDDSTPTPPTASSPLTQIWGFLPVFFGSGGILEFQPEFTSTASTIRKNIDRKFPGKQISGKRVDASIICSATRLELCAIEAGKIDIGPTGTKILTDG